MIADLAACGGSSGVSSTPVSSDSAARASFYSATQDGYLADTVRKIRFLLHLLMRLFLSRWISVVSILPL